MQFTGLQKSAVASLLVLLVSWAIIYFGTIRGTVWNDIFVLLYGIVPLIGGIFAMRSIRLWDNLKNDIGKAAFYLGLGLFLWGCGGLVWAYYNFFAGIEIPYPSVADFLYVPSVLFYAVGAVYLAKTTGAGMTLRSAFGKTFIILAPMMSLAVTYYVFVVVGYGGEFPIAESSLIETILNIGYPLMDMVALSASVIISGLSFKYLGGGYKYDIIAIMLGLALLFVADSLYSYLTYFELAYNGDISDLFYVLGICHLTMGALGFAKIKNTAQPAPAR